MEKLPGYYISGFVDGEGCFALKFRRDIKRNRKNSPTYFYWDIEFAIVLRADDKAILEKIRDTLGCGRISNSTINNAVRYAVNDLQDISNKIVPFFERYTLYAKKKQDFDLWKEAVKIFEKNQRNWDEKDADRIKGIHKEMQPFKSNNRSGWKWLDMTQNGECATDDR